MSGSEIRRLALRRSLVGFALLLASPAAAATMEGWEVRASSFDPDINSAERVIYCKGDVLPEPTLWETGSIYVGMGSLIFNAVIIAAYVSERRKPEGERSLHHPYDMLWCLGWAVASWLIMVSLYGHAVWKWVTMGFPSARLF